MLKKVKPYISLLAAATMAFSSICNVNAEEIKQKEKVEKPASNNVIIGDIVVPFTVANILNGMTYAISERGQDPNNLNVYFTRNQRGNVSYFDFRSDFSTKNPIDLNDGTKAWLDAKIEYNPSTKEVISFNTNVPTSSSIGIKPRAGYEGIITIDGDQVKIPANTTPKILKGAIQSDNGIFGQTYELFDGDTAVADDVSLATGNTLKVTSEDGTANHTYNLVVQSGGGGGQEDSADLEFKTNLDQGTVSYTAGATDVEPLTVEVQGKDGATTGTISYQWYKQTVGTSPLRATAVPVGEAIEGETNTSFTPPVNAVGTTLYYVIATNTEDGKKASSVASKMVTVVVTEGELTEDEFTVSDYVYNNESKTTDTMGKLSGTAPSGAKITIEANFTKLAEVDATDGKWEATFPRQNAGTIIKVTAVAGGKTKVQTIEVKKADTKALEDFRKSIDLNKLIEVRENLQYSADGKDISSGYWMNDKTEGKKEIEAFKTYVSLIEAVLSYKYQISDIDLNYVQNIALEALKTYEGKIHKAGGEVTNTVDLSINISGEGTLKATYEDGSDITVEGSTYKVNKGSKVKFDATTKEGNVIKFTWNEGQPDSSGDKNTLTVTKQINTDTTLDVLFASKDNMETAEKVQEAIKEAIDTETKTMTIETTQVVSDAEAAKPIVQNYVKDLLTAKGIDENKVSIEITKEESLQRLVSFKYTIIIKDKDTGAELYKITLTIEFVNNEADFTVTTKATNGTITAKYEDGKNIPIKGNGTFFVDAKETRKVTFTAKADEGYKFKNWVVDGVDGETTNTLTRSITGDTTIEAVFEKEGDQPPEEDTYDITLNVTGNGVVKVVSDDADMSVNNGVYTSKSGSTLTFEAIPQSGYEVEWPTNVTVNAQNKNVATLSVSKDDTVTVNFKSTGSEEGDSTTPSVGSYEFDMEQSDAKGDLYVKLTGTAGKDAKITFKNGNEDITPLTPVTVEADGTWTAVLPRQDGGSVITVIAKEEGKKEATYNYTVPVATTEDAQVLTNLISKIDTEIIKVVKVSDDGKNYYEIVNGEITSTTKPLTKGDKYISKVEYESVDTLSKLLEKIKGQNALSKADIAFIESKAEPACEAAIKAIKTAGDIQQDVFDVKVNTDGNGKVDIEYNGNKVPQSVGETVYSFEASKDAKVKFTATPNEGYELDKWLVDKADAGKTNPLEQTITANKEVKAVFKVSGSEQDKPMNLVLEPITHDSVTVGDYVYTTVTADADKASDFKVQLISMPTDKVEATYVTEGANAGKIAIKGIKASTTPVTISVIATAEGYENGTGTITVTKVEDSEVPPTEKTATPMITGYELTMLPTTAKITGYENIVAQVTGTATAGSEITLKDGNGAVIATEVKVVTDSDNNWTAILVDRLEGGTEVVATAKLDGKLESDASVALKIEKAPTTNSISELIDTIDKRLKSVGSSEIGDGTDVTPSATITEYLPKTDYEAITTLRSLLDKLLKGTVSVQDITFVETDVTEAWNVTEAKIKDIPGVSGTVKLTLSATIGGTVTITAADGDIIGDPSTVTDGVYTIKNGATVTINAIPDASNKIVGWTIDGNVNTTDKATSQQITVDKATSVEVIFAASEKVETIEKVVEEVNKVKESAVTTIVKEASTPEETAKVVKTEVDKKVREELKATGLITDDETDDIRIVSIDIGELNTNLRATNTYTCKATVTLNCNGVIFTVIIDVTVTITTADVFGEINVPNITDAVVNQARVVNVTGAPTDKNFNLTTDDTRVDVSYDDATKELTVTPKEELTNEIIKLNAKADGFANAVVKFRLTATESTTEKENFGELRIDAITDGVKGEAVTRTVYGLPEAGIASFSLTVPTDMAGKISINHTKGSKDVEITPLTVLTNEAIKLTAKADNYNDKDISFQVTATEATTEKENFGELRIDAITDGVKGEAVTRTVYGLPEAGIASFSLTVPTDMAGKISINHTKGSKDVEITPLTVLTNEAIKLTAKADNYNDKDISFQVTATEAGGETPDKKDIVVLVRNDSDNFEDSKSVEATVYSSAGFNNTTTFDEAVNTSVYKIYAKLSDPQVAITITNDIPAIVFDLVPTFDGEPITNATKKAAILNQFTLASNSENRRTYEAPIITLFDEKGNSLSVREATYSISDAKLTVKIASLPEADNGDSLSYIEVNFLYGGNNTNTRPLQFKAYKPKETATTKEN